MARITGNDEILILAIMALRDNAYGATIMQHLTRVTGREWSIGAIYDPLHRMERHGLVRSELTAPSPERGGRSKRVYHVTESGREALRRLRDIREAVSRGIPGSRPEPGSG